jgi:hypothetical protein
MKTPGSRWTVAEDKILLDNWNEFNKMYKMEGENDWQCFDVNGILPESNLLTFYRFLGQGLPKRTLQSIHCRFIHLKKHGTQKVKVPFSPAEDAYILRFIRVYQKRDVYARLGSILGRDRRCLRVHCEKLKKVPKNVGTFSEIAARFKSISTDNLTRVLQAIMKCVKCSTVKKLQQVKKIPWIEVAKQVNLSDTQVYRLWVVLFYSAIRLERKECYYPILLTTIEEIEKRNCESMSDVPWKKIAKKLVFYHQVILRELLQRFLYRVKQTDCDFKRSLQLVKLLVTELDQKETFNKNEYFYPLRFTEDGTVLGFIKS